MQVDPSTCLAATTAAALNLGSPLARTSAGLALAQLLLWAIAHGLSQPVLACGAASLVAALLQAYYALRVRFDAQLFSQLSLALQTGRPEDCLAQLDNALHQLGLLPATPAATTPSPTRPLAERARGAMALLKKQLLALLAQMVLLALGLMLIAVG